MSKFVNPVFCSYQPTQISCWIFTSDWTLSSGVYTVTKSNPAILSDGLVIVDPSDPNVQCTGQSDGSLTFTASKLPTSTVTIKVVLF